MTDVKKWIDDDDEAGSAAGALEVGLDGLEAWSALDGIGETTEDWVTPLWAERPAIDMKVTLPEPQRFAPEDRSLLERATKALEALNSGKIPASEPEKEALVPRQTAQEPLAVSAGSESEIDIDKLQSEIEAPDSGNKIYVPKRSTERDLWVKRWDIVKAQRALGTIKLDDLDAFLCNHYPKLTCSKSILSRIIKAGLAGLLGGSPNAQ